MDVRTARDDYFAENGFSEATYRDRWVRLSLGPVPLVMWNPPARQRAIALHDLHHVATGYATTWAGEAEIGAWEIGSGCGGYSAAWFYNAFAFAFGFATHPRRTYRAFVRGRHSRSLYTIGGWRDELLALDVTELRRDLVLDRDHAATWGDRLAYVVGVPWAFVRALTSVFSR
jgi:hypothetical protein